ncbi:argininosuccinate lyase [Enterocloster clostridioformis]|uniref:argininosuccinate lyase n=5 Tax=Enterocloster clostridioformis TaxID=1531 RepID=UPI00080C9BB9|nr:argininosuccinate lyase [Enterocloster clostridioformis]ANU47958.1 argininosuccinate lyase [Lachnoclostridium sp. YL32]NDO29742.1 argininosuccinate lyase [Enterocloster clostridioformis]OXE69326.1 argininosuccinate lyase [Enterocloster clostridioformis]QQR03144.1 argininosuccinate lyase [Enterocloster clostridioformis]
MRKQTKLVAVLSTAALLAIGASMTSFAATGWAEEDGTWVYYNRDGERATDQWKKSGNNWYWLDSDGEMAIDQLIEDGDNYYYVDINGVMAANQWVAIDNEDAGQDDEPDHYWYYFQANGKALTQGDNDKVSLKTVNGKKYAFDDEGRMLFGWVDENSAERVDDTDGDAFKEGTYYFGGEDDGAMTVGWLQLDVTYDEATNDEYKYTAPVFNDDEDQTRWFYFKSNGKKIYAEDGDRTKDKTINGKKYAFDEYGAMVAEWSLDEEDLEGKSLASYSDAVKSGKIDAGKASANDIVTGKAFNAKYSEAWKYFNSVEDGARVSKGWFKVVPAEYLNDEKYNDDEDYWYYADGSGNLYAGEFKTIKGKKYAFRNDGRMIDGLKFIYEDKDAQSLTVWADDDDPYRFDSEDDFDDNAPLYEAAGYYCYYFGNGDDGAMRTNKTTVEIDGENFNFYFEKSGGKKGAGLTGEKDDKFYQSGKLLKADTDDKYSVVQRQLVKKTDGTINSELEVVTTKDSTTTEVYNMLDDVDELLTVAKDTGVEILTIDDLNSEAYKNKADSILKAANINKDLEDLREVYIFGTKDDNGNFKASELNTKDYFLVNTSGKVFDSKGRHKDGSDYYYALTNGGKIAGIYVED